MNKVRLVVWPMAMLGTAAFFYLYEFLLRVAPGAMFSELMRDFSITATDLGLLSSFYFMSYALLQAPVGVFTDQYGPRRLLTLASALCGLGALLFGYTDSFWAACLCRLIVGAGSAFAFICCMKIAGVWFKPQYFPLLAGLVLTLGNAGAVVGQGPVTVALQFIDWRDFTRYTGYVGIGLTLILWLVVRDNPNQIAVNPSKSTGSRAGFFELLGQLLKHPQNWLIGLYGFLSTAPTDAFGGLWAVPYLVDAHGLSHIAAATAASMTFVGVGCGSPFLGWLSNRIRNRRRVMAIGAFGAMISLLLVIYLPSLTLQSSGLLLFLFGFFGSYVMTFVVIQEINSTRLVGTAAGFANMMSIMGSTLLQYAIGRSLDIFWDGSIHDGLPRYSTHAFQMSLLVLPACYALCLFVLVPMIKESYNRKLSHS